MPYTHSEALMETVEKEHSGEMLFTTDAWAVVLYFP
jgi:hypothetical protein